MEEREAGWEDKREEEEETKIIYHTHQKTETV